MSRARPTPRSRETADIKLRQLQPYLHRPGHIPASVHPLLKQAAEAAAHRAAPRQQSPLLRLRMGRDAIVSLLRLIGRPIRRQSFHPPPRDPTSDDNRH